MKFRGYAWFLSAIAVMAIAAPAFAQIKIGDPTDPNPPEVNANCDVTGYKSFEQVLNPPVAIPDNIPAGVTVGPINTPADGSNINDVVFEIQLAHTWIGDIVATLLYDSNCDGITDASARVICRPRGTGTANVPCGAGLGVGCSSNFVTQNVIRITDGVGTTLADGTCPGDAVNIPAGCYRTATAGDIGLAFGGRPKGGCWRLNVSDNAGIDVGTISRWAVHILNSPTANTASTWGSVKTLYR